MLYRLDPPFEVFGFFVVEDPFSFVGGLPALALSNIWLYGLEWVGDIGTGIEKNYDFAGFLIESRCIGTILYVHP